MFKIPTNPIELQELHISFGLFMMCKIRRKTPMSEILALKQLAKLNKKIFSKLISHEPKKELNISLSLEDMQAIHMFYNQFEINDIHAYEIFGKIQQKLLIIN